MAFRGTVVAGVLFVLPSAALAATTEIGPTDDLQQAVDALGPGDELVLRGGTYTLTSRFSIAVSGTEQAPIVIRAKDGEAPILTRDASQNTVNIDGATYVALRGIEIEGGSHGIRMDGASFITIEDCHVHDTADVGISANVPGSSYEGLVIRHNHIHDTGGTGEGMYLGCNSDGCRMFASLIEQNLIHDTQTGVSQGDGIEIKEGSYENIVRDNVIFNTNYPCILTYSTVGNGGPNVIERNVMWGCGDYGIQSAADAIIVNNIILSAASGGIGCQSHQAGSPSNLEIVHNTVIVPSQSALRVSDISGPVLIANNALYAQNGSAIVINGGAAMVTVAGNAGLGGTSGVTAGFSDVGDIDSDFVAASFSGGVPNDPFPVMGSILAGAGDPNHVAPDDFNGTARDGVADIGAYKYHPAGNSGWPLGEGFKDPPPPSMGVGGSGGSDTGGASGSPSSSSAGGSTASGVQGGDPSADDGCSCQVPGSSVPERSAVWVALLAAIAAIRRERR